MRYIRLVLLLALPILFCVTFNSKRGILPPFGKLLDPANGFWQNCQDENMVPGRGGSIPGLKGKATVVYDERHVPHIFAENVEDLMFLQGFVTARDRLFQMDLQTRAAGGRLSEIIDNPAVLRNDRLMRRNGMSKSAEITVAAMKKDPRSRLDTENYTRGINAWIEQLTVADYPVEYKLLNFKPEPWTEVKCGLLLKLMSRDLTAHTTDMENTNSLMVLGDSMWASLFPDFPKDQSPIIPEETQWGFNAEHIDTPAVYKPLDLIPGLYFPKPEDHIGSNNWAVSGKKTKSGYPILCNDPHLGLRMPSLWYEVQLNAPGINCYGVSLPGAPGIIIGFNEKTAWGVTNASRDVMDWYNIEFKDANRNEYKYDGQWRKTEKRVEEIKLTNGTIFYDTVVYTHHGPVVYDKNFGQDGWPGNIAMRWAALDTSNEALTFHLLNRMQNYQGYRDALQYFSCPGQNIIYASSDGDIAITQQGRFPVKWPLQGDFLMDGSNPLHDWQAFIPFEANPTTLNPSRQYVSSANQHATDSFYPYNLAGRYEYFRNRRINTELAKMDGITPEDMKKFQNDNYNLKAAQFLPVMLRLLPRENLSETQKALLADLESWNFFNDADLTAPTVWEEWWVATRVAMFNDELGDPLHPTEWPESYTTGRILETQPNHPLIDNIKTPEVETAAMILKLALDSAEVALNDWKAKSGNSSLEWYKYNDVNVQHLLRLAPFGQKQLHMGGNGGIVNASRKNVGPSWRMVVELGPEVKAWGIYPGGPSGNPGSKHYDTYVEPWAAGEYNELHLYANAATAKTQGKNVQEFQPK